MSNSLDQGSLRRPCMHNLFSGLATFFGASPIGHNNFWAKTVIFDSLKFTEMIIYVYIISLKHFHEMNILGIF